MSIKSSIVQLVYVSIYKYVGLFIYITNLIFNPLINITKKISPSLGKGLDYVMNTAQKFLITIPFFMIIFGFSMYVFDDYYITNMNLINQLSTINLLYSLFFVLLVFLGIMYGFILHHTYNKDAKFTILVGSMISLSSLPLIAMNQAQVYAYLITLCYAIGAYTTTLIEFESPKKITTLIEENTGILNYVHVFSYVSIIFSIIIGINFFDLTNMGNINSTNIIVLLLTIILGFASYGFTKMQQHTYNQIYKHGLPDTSSRFYLFPSRIAIVYATMSVLLAQQVTLISGILFFIPAIMYFKFSRYVGKEKDTAFGRNLTEFAMEHKSNSKRRIHVQEGRKPNVKSLDYDTNTTNDGGVELELNLSIEIPDNQPALYNPWNYFLQTTDDVKNIINNLQTEDNYEEQKLLEYADFYDKVSKIGANQMIESVNGTVEFPFEKWSDELSNKIKENIHTSEEATMDDIINADIKIAEKNSDIRNPDKFGDKFEVN